MKIVISLIFAFFITLNLYSQDSIEVRMKMKSIGDTLSYNDSWMNDNYAEYSWEIRLDSDNNIKTGDNNGFDIVLSIVQVKTVLKPQAFGTIYDFFPGKIATFKGNIGEIKSYFYGYLNLIDTSIIFQIKLPIGGLIYNLNNIRFQAKSLYISSEKPFVDETSTTTIPNIINDPEGDAPYSFIDIKEVSVKFITSGVQYENDNNEEVIIYPNPNNGIFNIEYDKSLIRPDIELYDIYGNSLNFISSDLLDNRFQVDFSNYAPGVYFVRTGGYKLRKVVRE